MRRNGGGKVWVFARVALCCGIALTGAARAEQDYACPGGNFGRTGVYPGKGPDAKPDEWTVLVKRLYNSRIYSFIVFAGRIFTVSNGTLVATNFQGERKWEADITFPGCRPQSDIRMHHVLGWRDRVIVVSLNGSVKAFALDDGRLLWSRTGGELNMDGMPAVGFQRETHTPPPVVYKDCLHFAGERKILRLSMENGKELKPFEFLDDEIRKVIFTSPLALSDSKLFFCAKTRKGENAALYAIDLESGKISWKQEREGPFHDQILVEDRKVILVGRYVSGTEVWEGMRLGKPVVCHDDEAGFELPMKDTLTHGIGEVMHQGALFDSSNRELAKVDILKGKTLWKYRNKQKEGLSPAMAMGGGVI